MNLPKIVITDIDGVWTDGGMYYYSNGVEGKKFNVSDGFGVALLRSFGIETVFLTGEDNEIVHNRAKKLKIKNVIAGVKNKLAAGTSFCKKNGVNLSDVAFLGNDLNDLPLLEKVGISGVPADANDYLKTRVDYIMVKNGGEGVFREFVEMILNETNLFQDAISILLKTYGDDAS
jgi:3-deoxy-D-glycero-D-galacto-nononate 9-phosphatase